MSDQIPGTEPTQVFITVDRREGKTYVQWGIRGGRNRCIGIITRVPMDSSSPRARGIQYRYRAVHPITPRSIEDRTRYSWAQGREYVWFDTRGAAISYLAEQHSKRLGVR